MSHSELNFVEKIQQIEPILVSTLGHQVGNFPLGQNRCEEIEGILSSPVVLSVNSCARNGKGFGSTAAER